LIKAISSANCGLWQLLQPEAEFLFFLGFGSTTTLADVLKHLLHLILACHGICSLCLVWDSESVKVGELHSSLTCPHPIRLLSRLDPSNFITYRNNVPEPFCTMKKYPFRTT
jgi:hypothetical protein